MSLTSTWYGHGVISGGYKLLPELTGQGAVRRWHNGILRAQLGAHAAVNNRWLVTPTGRYVGIHKEWAQFQHIRIISQIARARKPIQN